MLVQERSKQRLDITTFFAPMRGTPGVRVRQQCFDDTVTFKKGLRLNLKELTDAQAFEGIVPFYLGL
jgi:hypothetical protein